MESAFFCSISILFRHFIEEVCGFMKEISRSLNRCQQNFFRCLVFRSLCSVLLYHVFLLSDPLCSSVPTFSPHPCCDQVGGGAQWASGNLRLGVHVWVCRCATQGSGSAMVRNNDCEDATIEESDVRPLLPKMTINLENYQRSSWRQI